MPEVRCAVLGSPVEHSLSPALHRAAYAELGLDWTYETHRVDAGELAGFVAGLDGSWRGLSLTMPLKEAVLELGDVDPLAAAVHAGNTLILDHGGARRVYNTDVDGLAGAVRTAGAGGVDTALLLGAGATARSAVMSLSRLGCTRLMIVARTRAHGQQLVELAAAHGIDATTLPWPRDPGPTAGPHPGFPGALPMVDLAVSAVPRGIADPLAERVAEVASAVFDAVYDPWPTQLATAAQRHHRIVISGLELLAHQAVEQIRLMTGGTLSAELLVSAGQEELRRRAGA